MFASFTTGPHFCSSEAMKAFRSAGEPPTACMLRLASVSCPFGLFRNALAAALSLSMISLGVPAGAARAYQAVASNPGNPAACTVFTSGRSLERLLVVTASARTLPSRTSGT